MPMQNTAFYQKPEQEQCQVSYEGCHGLPEVRLYCQTEQVSRLLCHFCHAEWRKVIVRLPFSAVMCPGCCSHEFNFAQKPEGPPSSALLRGPAAQAIDAAMHAEGLLVDIRQKVLQRLAKDAFWLESSPVVKT